MHVVRDTTDARGDRQPITSGFDDAGAAVRAISLRALGSSRADETHADRLRRRALVRRLRAAVKERAQESLPNWACVIAFGVGTVFLSVIAIYIAGLKALFTVIIAIFLFSRRISMWMAEWPLRSEIARTAVSEGWCGSCAYNLRGLLADSKGLIECPECGAAWRADRMTGANEVGSFDDSRLRRSNPITLFMLSRANRVNRYQADHRARLVPILDPRLRALRREVRRSMNPSDRVAIRRAMLQVSRGSRWTMWGLILTSAVQLGVMVWVGTMSNSRTNHGPLYMTASVLALFGPMLLFIVLVVIYIIFRLIENRQGRYVAEINAVLQLGFCPVCASKVASEHPEPDGCVICPGCRSAWRRAPDRLSPAPPRGSAEPVASRSAPQA